MKLKRKHVYFVLAGLVTVGGLAVLTREKIYQHFDYKTDLLLLQLTPDFREKIKKFLTKAKKEGILLRVISAYRDCEQQNKLYAKGRTAPGKVVTNAVCGKSSHNYKIAVDVVEFKDGKPLWKNPNWERIGQLGESCGLEWGGRWKSFVDKPHFQDLGGKKLSQLYKEYKRTGRLGA